MPVITIRTGDILDEAQKELRKKICEMFKMIGLGALSAGGCCVPAADMYETEQALVILVDIAGAKADRLDISLHRDLIRICGFREDPGSRGPRRFHQMEITYGAFERVLQIPAPVDADRAEASCHNGLLRIVLPKAPRRPPLHV